MNQQPRQLSVARIVAAVALTLTSQAGLAASV
jgi:hypothetical protein